MGFHSTLLFIHLTSACIWFGGYMVMSFVILPQTKRANDPRILIDFDRSFAKFALPALLGQLITGPLMALQFYPNVLDWFKFQNGAQDHIASKIVFLFIILYLFVRMRTKVMPRLLAGDPTAMKSASRSTHWITFLAFSNVLMGLSVHTGGFAY